MSAPTKPLPVERSDLADAMMDILRMIVDISPTIIWMVSEVPPQRWDSGWTRTISQMAALLDMPWPAAILSQHAEWLARVRETDRAYWTEVAICRPRPTTGLSNEAPPGRRPDDERKVRQ